MKNHLFYPRRGYLNFQLSTVNCQLKQESCHGEPTSWQLFLLLQELVQSQLEGAVGTGVGGGIVIENNLLFGAHGSGAEIGHMVLNPQETIPCNCGKCGCVEQYCSATGIARLGREALAASDEGSTLRTVEKLDAKAIFDAGKAGDKLALQVLDRYYNYLGQFLGSLCSVINPEVVVLGGGVCKAGQILLDGVEPYFHK